MIDSECGNKTPNNGSCPETSDTFICWPETPAGTIANHSCPKILTSTYTVSYNNYAFKECWPNGSWYFKSNQSSTHWTNYTMCLDKKNHEFTMVINTMYVVGYAISLVALIASLAIFIKFRSLKCTRIKIHIQLFVSFALANIMWIIHYTEVVTNSQMMWENLLWCQFLHVILQYLMISNYLWMFCEALHLHITLVIVFVRDEATMKWFYMLGWLLPMVFAAGYSLYRIYVAEDTKQCWIHDNPQANLILTVPVCISLILSGIFFANVLRVILTIMHPNSENPAPTGVKRVAKAALILVPLFGLHYLLLLFRPTDDSAYSHFYEYVNVLLIAPQGLFLSILFCFANQDVHQAFRLYMYRRRHRHSLWNNYLYTGTGDSAGVYVVNGSGKTNMISLKRKSTTATIDL